MSSDIPSVAVPFSSFLWISINIIFTVYFLLSGIFSAVCLFQCLFTENVVVDASFPYFAQSVSNKFSIYFRKTKTKVIPATDQN